MTNVKQYLLLGLIILPQLAVAQLSSLGPHIKIDTLKQLISKNKEDTNKVKNLILLSREFSKENTDTSCKIAEAALTLSKKLKWFKGIGNANIALGWSLYIQGNYNQAMACNFEAKKIGETYNEPQTVLYAFSNLGQIYYSQGDLNMALDYNSKALKIAQETNDEWNIARNIGIIGTIYQDMKYYDSSISHYLKAYHLTQKIGNSNGSGVWLSNIGGLYLKLNKYDSALFYLNKSNKIFDSVGNKWSYAETTLDIGKIYALTNNFKLSHQYLQQALQLSSKVGAVECRKNVYLELSNLYQKSNIRLPDINSKIQLNDAQRQNLALNYYKKYISLKDTIDNKEVQKKSLALEFEHKMASTKLAMEKKEAITKQQIQNQKIIRNAFITGSLLLLLLIAVIINRNKLKRKIEVEKIRNKLSRDLHDDIGSTLSSINILSRTAQSNLELGQGEKTSASLEKINERSQRLLSNMSDIIWNINPNNDTLEEVMSRMREYATALLEAKQIDYTFDFPKTTMNCKLSMEVKNNMYLIFKEAVNNLSKYSGSSNANLSLIFDEKNIQLTIQDNGIGFNLDDITHSGGLNNMRHRAEEIKGKISIISVYGKGTKVVFSVAKNS